MCGSVSYSFVELKRDFLEMCQTLPEKLNAEIKSLSRQASSDIPEKISKVVLKNIKQIKEVFS